MERMRMEKERLGRMEQIHGGNRSVKALYNIGFCVCVCMCVAVAVAVVIGFWSYQVIIIVIR